jgi:hypothetical protein
VFEKGLERAVATCYIRTVGHRHSHREEENAIVTYLQYVFVLRIQERKR